MQTHLNVAWRANSKTKGADPEESEGLAFGFLFGVFIQSRLGIDHGLVASIGVCDAKAHLEMFTNSHRTRIYLSLSVVNADFSWSEFWTGAFLTAFEAFLMGDVNGDFHSNDKLTFWNDEGT